MSGRFDFELMCKLIQEHKPQRAHLVPPIMLGLGKHPLVEQYDLSSLKMIVSAAAPLGVDTEETVKIRLDCGVKQVSANIKYQIAQADHNHFAHGTELIYLFRHGECQNSHP